MIIKNILAFNRSIKLFKTYNCKYLDIHINKKLFFNYKKLKVSNKKFLLYKHNLFNFLISMNSNSLSNKEKYIGSFPDNIISNPLNICTSEDLNTVKEFISFNLLNNNLKLAKGFKEDSKNINKAKQFLFVIITHSGAFHADEVLGVCLVKYLPFVKNYVIVRSRNNEVWKLADIILDVGSEFIKEEMKYDHHMSDFKETFNNDYSVKLSAAGLIYKFHGKDIIKNILNIWQKCEQYCDDKTINQIYNHIYKTFIHYVDCIDNGVNQYPNVEDRVFINNTSYNNRISRLNPSILNSNDQSIQFLEALKVANEEFLDVIKYLVYIYIPGYKYVLESYQKRFEFHKSGEVLYMDFGLSWKEHLNEIEKEYNNDGKQNSIKFVIFKTEKEGYRVSTVPITLGSFEFRKGIYSNWRGVDREQLKKISELDDIVFVHRSGFIGGALSIETAKKMVDVSLKE